MKIVASGPITSWEIEEEIKSLLKVKVKEESEKSGLKLSI